MASLIMSSVGRFGETLGFVSSRFPHGLLVVSDPGSRDSHDDWDPAREAVHAGPDSLYVSVLQAASGLVSVIVAERGEIDERAQLLYGGEIFLPSLSVQLYEPSESFHLNILVEREVNSIQVYGDDSDESSEIAILLRPA